MMKIKCKIGHRFFDLDVSEKTCIALGDPETMHKGLRYKDWEVISEVHQLVVFPPTYFRRETGLVAYPRSKYLTPPLSVKIHLIFIIF